MEVVKKVLYPNLRAEIARHGDSLNDLASVLGMSLSSISRRLAGDTPWTMDEINILCKRYNMSYEILFSRE